MQFKKWINAKSLSILKTNYQNSKQNKKNLFSMVDPFPSGCFQLARETGNHHWAPCTYSTKKKAR